MIGNKVQFKLQDMVNKGIKLSPYIASTSQSEFYNDEIEGYVEIIIGRKNVVTQLGIEEDGCPINRNKITYNDFCKFFKEYYPQIPEEWDEIFDLSIKYITEIEILNDSGETYKMKEFKIEDVDYNNTFIRLNIKIMLNLEN